MNKYLPEKFILNNNLIQTNKKKTILGNEKKKIMKKFTDAIANRNITKCLNACIELHCSGYLDSILSKLYNYYFDHINLANLPGISYIYIFQLYYIHKNKSIAKQKKIIHFINDQVVRNFLIYFVTYVLTCNQRKIIKLPKIKEIDFNLNLQKKSLISTNLNLAHNFLIKGDPKEIIIPISEICNYFSDNNHLDREHRIIYWISWLHEYNKVYHSNNMVIGKRIVDGLDSKYYTDFVWILWAIIKSYSNSYNSDIINRLYKLYIQKYTKGSKKNIANLIIIAVLLIINPLPKIQFPIQNISNEQYKQCTLHSLKCNTYYLTLLQHI